jgi:hypothetical protein
MRNTAVSSIASVASFVGAKHPTHVIFRMKSRYSIGLLMEFLYLGKLVRYITPCLSGGNKPIVFGSFGQRDNRGNAE